MTITWRPDNESDHFQKHHVTFDQARRVFTASDRRVFKDTRPNDYNEERFVIIGTVDKRMLFVVFTKMNDEIVIIGARRLTKRQQARFKL